MLRCTWQSNFKMDLKGMGMKGVVWINLVQDRDLLTALVNTAMNIWVP
jgi:hypothetical protein